MATENFNNVKQAKTSPSYLSANATSHTWAFSAIAELVDNAYDPDVKAKQLWIDVRKEAGLDCLEFVDNGNGMDPDCLYRMLSFGFCEKAKYKDDLYHKPIGHYGNGFKSGSMRLGKDAIVFTKRENSMSVGFLSQTYLEKIGADTVLVPMVTWDTESKRLSLVKDAEDSMKAILQYSLFKTEFQLRKEFERLDDMNTGTKIIIYNLKKTENDKTELDFESDPKDILNHSNHTEVLGPKRTDLYVRFTNIEEKTTVREHIPVYKISVREYCSILYLKPWMQIFLRGHKVKTRFIYHSLSGVETDYYKPQVISCRRVPIKFGFDRSKLDYGLMMYHNNRLIKAYKRVGCQKQPQIRNGKTIARGVGVVGVVEVNFLQPIHNKQDFEKSDLYNLTILSLGKKLNEYWNAKTNQGTSNNDGKKPDLWAQCDSCFKWRRLPDEFSQTYTAVDLPEEWHCYMNQDLTHNRCHVEEEKEEEVCEVAKATYEKPKKQSEKGKHAEIQLEYELLQAEKDKLEQVLAEKENQLQIRAENENQNVGYTGSEVKQNQTANVSSRTRISYTESAVKRKRKLDRMQTEGCESSSRSLEEPEAVNALRMIIKKAAAKSAVTTAEVDTQTEEVEEDAADKEKITELNSKLEMSEQTLQELRHNVVKLLGLLGTYDVLKLFEADNALHVDEISKIDAVVASITSVGDDNNNDPSSDDEE